MSPKPERISAMVALRKESVDRNVSNDTQDICNAVALRKESVDRNPVVDVRRATGTGRSPQGERG